MGLTTIPRTVAKLEYSAIRLPFTLVDRHVVARYWDDEASVRLGFERFLGALDRFTGRLLGDDIGQRGGAPGRRTGSLAAASRLDTKAQAAWAKATTMMPGGLSQVLQAGVQASAETDDKVAAPHQDEQEDSQQLRREADAEKPPAGHAPRRHAEEHDMSVKPAAQTGTVDVTFTLPAEIQADSVALCGQFNDWSADSIRLERVDDGSWRATVALEPGRTYRYRYLLDGEHWENAWQADGYVPNSYGGEDSIIVVE